MKYLLTAALIMLMSHSDASAGERYELGKYYLVRSTYETDLIEGFNVEQFGNEYLPGYSIKKYAAHLGYWQPHYTFFQNVNESSIYVTVRVSLFPDVGAAETATLEFLNSGNLLLEYGPYGEVTCGDNFWWYAIDDDLWYIIFIRKNALAEVSTSYIDERRYDDLMSLARQIDQNLLEGVPYAMMSDTIQAPEITGVDVEQSKLKLGDIASIEVSAFDPHNTELLYKGDWFKGPVDGENDKLQFRITEVSVPLGETFEGDHTFYVWVVNEMNMHSYKYPVKLSF